MKKNSILRKAPSLVIILGLIILLLGFYFEGIRAGIPYQDPTPELIQNYNDNMNIGYILYKISFIILFIGFVTFIIQKVKLKLYKR